MKRFNRKYFVFVCMMCSVLIWLSACGKDEQSEQNKQALETVQNGYLGSYEQITVKEAMEFILTDGIWDSSETDSGIKFVRFHSDDESFKVVFIVSDDYKSFQVTYIEDGQVIQTSAEIKEALDKLYEAYSMYDPNCGLIIDQSSDNETMNGHAAGVKVPSTESVESSEVKETDTAKQEQTENRIELSDFLNNSMEQMILKAGLDVEYNQGESDYYTGYNDTLEIGAYSSVDGMYIRISGADAPLQIAGVYVGMELEDAEEALNQNGAVKNTTEDQNIYTLDDNNTVTLTVDERNVVSSIYVEHIESLPDDHVTSYTSIINQVNADYGDTCWYSEYDIDKDGMPELIATEGTCNADYTNYVYTYRDGETVLLGQFPGATTYYGKQNQNEMIVVSGSMDYETVSKITVDGDQLVENPIFEGQVSDGEYYSTDDEILSYDVNDLSGIY